MKLVPWTTSTSCTFEAHGLCFYTEIWHVHAKSRCYSKPVRLVELAKISQFWTGPQQAKRCGPFERMAEVFTIPYVNGLEQSAGYFYQAKEVIPIFISSLGVGQTSSEITLGSFSYAILHIQSYNNADGADNMPYFPIPILISPNRTYTPLWGYSTTYQSNGALALTHLNCIVGTTSLTLSNTHSYARADNINGFVYILL